MADALCGPANPLQNLRKHTQVDRTLQQDRLVGPRQSPAQGFRSVDPRTGSLDAEFAAFENAAPSPFQFAQPEFAHALPVHSLSPAPSSASWAADFQKLNISGPIPPQQFRQEAPLVRSAAGDWHGEFMRQRSGQATLVSQGKQAVRDAVTGPAGMDGQYMPYSGMGHQNYAHMFPTNSVAQPLQQNAQMPDMQHLSDAAFADAFADAFAHAQAMDQESAKSFVHDTPLQESVHDQPIQDAAHLPKIGSDTITYVDRENRTADQDTRDADELARTAGQLLNSVSHDTSSKFRQSQFLDLMRRIRDREVEVQDNDLTPTTAQKMSVPLAMSQVEEVAPNTLPQSADSTFQFPDMNSVYSPQDSQTAVPETGEAAAPHGYPGTWDYPPVLPGNMHTMQRPPFTTYGFDDDQSLEDRAQDLHPGGEGYPQPEGSPRPGNAEMSGGLAGSSIDDRVRVDFQR